jgi:hypothetical protein
MLIPLIRRKPLQENARLAGRYPVPHGQKKTPYPLCFGGWGGVGCRTSGRCAVAVRGGRLARLVGVGLDAVAGGGFMAGDPSGCWVGAVVRPSPPSCVAVLREWQEWQSDWRLSGSLVPPRAMGVMWSTSVAETWRPVRMQVWQSGWVASCWRRIGSQRRPYPRFEGDGRAEAGAVCFGGRKVGIR